ncbi:hypothetical protein V5109_16315 [Acinetobacter baumannii]
MSTQQKTTAPKGFYRMSQLATTAARKERKYIAKDGTTRIIKARPERQGLLPMGETTIWDKVRTGDFPTPIKSLRYDSFGLMMIFKKVLNTDQIIQLFQVLLKYAHYDYVYLNTYFFGDINIFPHRLETTAVCYVPVKIAEDYLPHLYKKVEVENQYNSGTILVFDEKWADETEELKKIVQENSIALVELGVIPETELPEGFFD